MIKEIYVYLGTAGIGRMRFGSWLTFDAIDRSDGNDDGTYDTIKNALVDAGREIERRMVVAAWEGKTFKPPKLPPVAVVAKSDGDVWVARVRWSGIRFAAEWMCWTPNGYQLEDVDSADYEETHADTVSEALGELGKRTQAQLAHHAWVNQFK